MSDDNVEVSYTIPIEKTVMIRESKIKDWEDEEEIKDYIVKEILDGDGYEDDVQITSIG